MAAAYAETTTDLTPAVYLGKQLTLRHLRGSRTIGGDLTLPIVVSTWRSAGPVFFLFCAAQRVVRSTTVLVLHVGGRPWP